MAADHGAATSLREKAVSKHIHNIFSKLGMPPSEDDTRRVLAVLASNPRRFDSHHAGSFIGALTTQGSHWQDCGL